MIPRFFVESIPPQSQQITLSPKESAHALKVLRLGAGDAVEVFDARGSDLSGFITSTEGYRVVIHLQEEQKQRRDLPFQVDLVFSVIKSEPADLLIRQACELGVNALYPVLTDRSVVRLSPDRWKAKQARWQKIIIASCKQCGRSQLPMIAPVTAFKELVGRINTYDTALIPTLAVRGRPFFETFSTGDVKTILAFIGPEGDFTRKETELAIEAGASAVHLGPLVMRSETAAVYVLSALHFYYGGKYFEKNV